jgi:hypothetical protein
VLLCPLLVACPVTSAPPPPAEVALKTRDSAVRPWSLIELRADGRTWAAERYEATWGAARVTLLRASPEVLVTLVPDDAPGGERLSFTEGPTTYRSAPLEVLAPVAAVENPEAFVRDTVEQELSALALERAKVSDSLQPVFDRAEVELRDARARFEALTPEERAQCARLIQLATLAPRAVFPRVLRENLEKNWVRLLASTALAAAAVSVTPVWVAGGVVAGVAAGLLGPPVVAKVTSFMATAYSEVLVNFEREAFSNAQPLLGSISFVQGVPRDMPLNWTLRTLQRSDLNAPGELGALARLVEEVHLGWPQVVSAFTLPPPPPIFQAPARVESVKVAGSNLFVQTTSGGVRLVKQEPRERGLRLTFDDGLTDSPGPMTPRDFDFTLQVFDSGALLVVPATLIGRHGTLALFESPQSGSGSITYSTYALATGVRRQGAELAPASSGSSSISAYDPAERRIYVLEPGGAAFGRVTGVDEETGQREASAPLTRPIIGMHARRDGKLLLIEIDGQAGFELAVLDADTSSRVVIGTVVPPQSPGPGGGNLDGIPTAGHVYDSFSNRLYVLIVGDSGARLLELNATSGERLRSFPVPGGPAFVFATSQGVRVITVQETGVWLEGLDLKTGRFSTLGPVELDGWLTDFRAYDSQTDQIFLLRFDEASRTHQAVGISAQSGSRGVVLPLEAPFVPRFGIHMLRPRGVP